MAGAYSADLRSRVLAAVEAGESVDAAARRFAVGRSTAYRWVAVVRDEGRREAKPVRGGPVACITGVVEVTMLDLAGSPQHLTLAEITARLAEAHDVHVHLTTVHRALPRAGWTWKKLSLRATEQDRQDVATAREAWWTDRDGVGGIDPARLVFLDECGVLTNLVRRYGRSPCGTRACASAPFGHWTRVTVLGALGTEGIVGAMSVEAATSAAVFHAYLGEVLLPELRRTRPDAVLVMDTLSPSGASPTAAPLEP